MLFFKSVIFAIGSIGMHFFLRSVVILEIGLFRKERTEKNSNELQTWLFAAGFFCLSCLFSKYLSIQNLLVFKSLFAIVFSAHRNGTDNPIARYKKRMMKKYKAKLCDAKMFGDSLS